YLAEQFKQWGAVPGQFLQLLGSIRWSAQSGDACSFYEVAPDADVIGLVQLFDIGAVDSRGRCLRSLAQDPLVIGVPFIPGDERLHEIPAVLGKRPVNYLRLSHDTRCFRIFR